MAAVLIVRTAIIVMKFSKYWDI